MADLPRPLERDNEEALGALVDQLRAPMGGVIPFVGAGMSKAYGFPTWEQFLREESEGSREIDAEIDAGRYMEAAESLQRRLGGDRFHRRINHTFNRPPDTAQLTRGPLWVLAALVRGPVLTTNFDSVLEHVFDAAGNTFDEVIVGTKIDSIVSAIHTGRHELLKLHGTAEERASRTFTLLEYQETYETGGVKVPDLALLLFGNRPLLFLGASLAPDRTVAVLQDVHERLVGVRHFAFVAAGDDAASRRDELDALGISPIWFPNERFDLIEHHLWQLHDQVAGHALQPPSPGAAGLPDGRAALNVFTELPDGIDKSAQPANPLAIKPVVRAALDGRLAFVLAPQMHSSTLAKKVGASFKVSEFLDSVLWRRIIASRGSDVLLDAVKDAVAATSEQTNVEHRFLAALPGFLRHHQRLDEAAQIIFSADYGTLLEQAFEAVGEPFHLLYYLSSGEYQGCFLHLAPDNAARVIERPEQMAGFREQVSVIVKLRGGVLHHGIASHQRLPESISIEDGDIARSAGNLLRSLPRSIRLDLRQRQLLLLGYGLLNLPEVDTLIRWRGTPKALESWAFQGFDDTRDDEEYWRQHGVHRHSETPAAVVVGMRDQLLATISSGHRPAVPNA